MLTLSEDQVRQNLEIDEPEFQRLEFPNARFRTQHAPPPLNTARGVAIKIFRSSQIDQVWQ